jgi:dihydrofolate reductase
LSDKIELTLVHHNFEADAFPSIDLEEWEIINSEFQQKDEKHLIILIKPTLENKTPQQVGMSFNQRLGS